MLTNIYPSLSFIVGITQGVQTTAMFSAPHEFTSGENVGFRVTAAYGMPEINNKVGTVLNITTYTITVNIDSSGWNPFVIPGSTLGTTPPTCVPSSSGVIPYSNPGTMNLQDAFDNLPGQN